MFDLFNVRVAGEKWEVRPVLARWIEANPGQAR